MRGIAITGPMCAGKDFVAGYICSLNTHYRHIAFSRFIKDYIVKNGLTPDGEIDYRRDRQLMQRLGREHDPTWTHNVWYCCRALEADWKVPVVTGVRTELNERTMRCHLEYPIVLISAPLELRIQRAITRDGVSREQVLGAMDDPTEAHFDKMRADYIFDNSETNTALEFTKLAAFIAGQR